MEAFFRGSHTSNFVTCGFSKSYNQAAEVPSSNVTCKSPRSPSINCRIMLAFVSITHSITIFPAPFLTAIEMFSLYTSIPIYFLSFNMRVLLSCRDCASTQTLLQKERPFILRPLTGMWLFAPRPQWHDRTGTQAHGSILESATISKWHDDVVTR